MSDGAAPGAGARPLRYGEALRLIHAASNRNPRFALGSLGGRFALICAVADPVHPDAAAALAAISPKPLDETQRVCAVFTSSSKDTPELAALGHRLVFADPDAARTCGLVDPAQPQGRWLLFDQTLRVMALWPLSEAGKALAALEAASDSRPGNVTTAPVLIAPRIFEPPFCLSLIDYYRRRGGEVSGVTQQDETGRTFVKVDGAFKRRSDCLVEDDALREAIMQRIYWRLAPMIERAFMWRPTRMERYLVACYNAADGGFFKPHRDNTTKGTAHRRFAVTINLNAEDYDGGDLRFPEFGAQTYRAPTGGAVVFSCGLLHEATPVTRGERYAFLPFLYDDAAAKIREANNKYLDESIRPYNDS